MLPACLKKFIYYYFLPAFVLLSSFIMPCPRADAEAKAQSFANALAGADTLLYARPTTQYRIVRDGILFFIEQS
jgi:hypothetical protein